MGPWRHLSSFPVATSASDTQQNSVNVFLSLVWWNGSGYFPLRLLLELKFLANSSNRDVAMGDSLKVYPRDLSQNSLCPKIDSGSLCCNYSFSFPFPHHPNVLTVYLFVYMCFLKMCIVLCTHTFNLYKWYEVVSLLSHFSPLSIACIIHPYCGFI